MDLIKLPTLLLLLISIREVITQSSNDTTCTSCIGTADYVWCSHPNFSQRRCQHTSKINCPEDFIVRSKSSRKSIPQSPGSKSKRMVQPSMVNVEIRPGEPVRFDVEFKQLKSHPVDIYVLLDRSRSHLKETRNGLARNFSKKLAGAMNNLTDNLQLGLGTFVEKPIVPFGIGHPEIINTDCNKGARECEPPHTFRHLLSFGNTSNQQFNNALSELMLHLNEDKPESGFDGIVQAIVCRDIVKWRNDSRKILVYVSDDKFHVAGDGKALGIVTPNDGCCHLNTTGFYNESTRQDYPSVSQVVSIARKNSIYLMFAIEVEHQELYGNFAKLIDGARVGLKKQEDVIHMITEMYRNITSSVTLQHKNFNDHLRITYHSRCLNKTKQLTQTNKCDDVKINDTVKFEIELELPSCPENETDWKNTFHIQPIGVDDKLTVNVIMNCDCNCKNTPFERNSSKCSHHGNFDCGVCKCDFGYSGEKCSCAPGQDVNTKCFKDKDSLMCSSRGRCDCNRCICNVNSQTGVPSFYGEFCECSNYTCSRSGGHLCSGKGNCICNKCHCQPGWTKDDCSCDIGTSNCMSTGSDIICSGNGHCECNKCVCDPTKKYTGKLCGKCPRSSTTCDELKNCVSCLLDTNNPDDCKNLCLYNSQIVEDLENNPPNLNDYMECRTLDSSGCLMTYYHSICQETNVKIRANKECYNFKAHVTGFVITIVTAIIVVGLTFLLVWKAFIIVQDRREYKRFEKEKSKATWSKRGGMKPEVKSKIGDYIRGKISARSLMHPSRLNTKPIDKRRYNLDAGMHQPEIASIRPEYQRKIRRPPLKDYIEGKVKLSDMISPSRITFIPKERKYHGPDTATGTMASSEQFDASFEYKRSSASPFQEVIKIVTTDGTAAATVSPTNVKSYEWHHQLSKMTNNEFSLVPIRNSAHGPSRKRKLMCKIKVQQSNGAAIGSDTKTEEHVIEIPEKLLRDNRGLPKFLMDRYNIPCYVNTAARRESKSTRPLAITSCDNVTAAVSAAVSTAVAAGPAHERRRVGAAQAIEYRLDADGETSRPTASTVETNESVDMETATSREIDNLPSDQGDHNPTTTYVFEFYEEDATSSAGGGSGTKSAIIEEIDDERPDAGRRSYMDDVLRGSRNCLPETPRSDRFQYQQYDELKSNVYFQRELIDLHREMLKFDKNVMGVERNIHRMTTALSLVESVQNDEIKPVMMTMKTENDRMKSKIALLENENDELKKTLQYLRKKTCNYDRLIRYMTRNSNTKMQQLEEKLTTITQAQVKSIMMQNAVNKNIFQLTKDIKRTCSEQDSKTGNSVKSPKDSNITVS